MHGQRRIYIATLFALLLTVSIASTVYAQQAGRPAAEGAAQGGKVVPRPPVFFHEAWKKPEGSDPRRILGQEWVSSPNLELKLYGPGTKGKGKDNQDDPRLAPFAGSMIVNVSGEPNNFNFIWDGFTEGNWALTLKDKNRLVNLAGPLTKIRWMSSQCGFHQLRPVVKTADGEYYVGDKADGLTADFHETEIGVADVRWLELNPMTATELGLKGWQNPDLSKVDEVGFTALSRGTSPGCNASTRVVWIEVVGYPVPRTGTN